MLPTDIYKWNDYLLSYTTENLHKKKTKQSPEYSSQTITNTKLGNNLGANTTS